MALERLSGFTGREGWKNLTAIQNGEVYGVDHGSLRFMGDYVYTEAIAKMIYPDLFEDIDPQAEMEHFYEKYLPEMDHTGTYYIKWRAIKHSSLIPASCPPHIRHGLTKHERDKTLAAPRPSDLYALYKKELLPYA